ncbi:hypothetical protein COCNU_scaffold001583G000040 [Cocos nucifera]|nr:hypothetical protein [Cocos nucifera]
MRNLNIVFGQQTFIKGFELYEGRVAQKIFKLNLSFLEEDDTDEEAGPSDVAASLTPIEPASCPLESTMEMPEPAQKPEAAKSVLTSSATASSEVEGLK